MPRALFGACALCLAGLLPPASAQAQKDQKPKPAKEIYVIVKADLFEVDDAFYRALLQAPWPFLEEMERDVLDPPKGKESKSPTFFDILAKQKPLAAGKEIDIDPGKEDELFALKKTIRLLPSPENLRQGRQSPQVIEESLTYRARVVISPDLRSVRVTFTEKSVALEGTAKHSVRVADKDTKSAVETAYMKEATVIRARDIPDGSTLLLTLTHRPRELKEKGRWLIARVTPRIYIEAEERALRGEGGK